MIEDFRSIIDLFGEIAEFAQVIRVPVPTASSMRYRNAVDGKYFDAIVEGAQARGHRRVTHRLLCKIAAQKREEKAVANG